MADYEVGSPVQIAALDDHAAILLTKDACLNPSTCTTSGGGGLWVVEAGLFNPSDPSEGVNTITYTPIAFSSTPIESFDTSSPPPNSCSLSSDYFSQLGSTTAQATFALDPTSDPAGEIRIYVSSRTCGAALITFYRGYESSADWTSFNLYSDSAAVSGHEACVLPDNWLFGVQTNRDASIVLWHGGGGNAQNVTRTLVCATYPGTSGTEMVVKPTSVNGKVKTMLAHPHVDDTWFFGTLNGELDDHDTTYDGTGAGEDGCDPTTGSISIPCTPNAVFLLQRRYNPGAGRFDWYPRPLVQEDIAAPRIQDLAWGAGSGVSSSTSLAMDHLYITTAGSGTYDALLSW
jgi:hypothetical protein